MHIDKIITFANKSVEIRFLAMERSLRATGCNLPLLVIPYDNNTFELPSNATWWEIPEMIDWLESHNAHKTYRKYQCFMTRNYQFVDSDVVFLKNPEEALAELDGFITSCGHWRDSAHSVTTQSLQLLRNKYSLWQTKIFNSGQFACDSVLYTLEDLKRTAESELFKETCLNSIMPEQPGINMLVNATDIKINNVTLPPYNMESTWAGDYENSDYCKLWKPCSMPYLIHWAGCDIEKRLKIDELFLKYYNEDELGEWEEFVKKERKVRNKKTRGFKPFLRRLKNTIKILGYR